MVVRRARHPVDDLLEARGTSKRWLAQKLKMHDTQLNKYLSGALPEPSDLYERIADVLQVPVSFVTPAREPDVAAAVPIGGLSPCA
jgi:ribosome-binding protein aMBF1 (putative translation factor)